MRDNHLGETIAEIILTALIGIIFGFFVYIAVVYATNILQGLGSYVDFKIVTLTVLPLQIVCSVFISVLSLVLFVVAKKTGENVDINDKLQTFFKIFAICVFVITIGLDIFVFIVHDYMV